MDFTTLNNVVNKMLEATKGIDSTHEFSALLGTFVDFWGAEHNKTTEEIFKIMESVTAAQKMVYAIAGRAELE